MCSLPACPRGLDHGTTHPGQDPGFHSDMNFLHVIPNERRITHVFVSLNAAPTKVWACASSRDCQLEDNSEFLINHTISFLLPRLSTFFALNKGGGVAGPGWGRTRWLVWVLLANSGQEQTSSSLQKLLGPLLKLCGVHVLGPAGFLSFSSSKILELNLSFT